MSNKIYFTPGPAQLFYSFQDHLKKALWEDIPSISHRSSQFISVMQETTEALGELLELPKDYHVFYVNSANEAWDRIIQNLVINSSHHFTNGSFSKKFYDFALAHGMDSTQSKADDGQHYHDFTVPDAAELIGITKNETSVGHSFLEEEIAQLRRENPDALIALDVVSASPSLPVDFKQVDTAYFSVQKGFGMPAGLGVWIANERCIDKAAEKSKNASIGSYRTLPNLKKFGLSHQTPETPNMLFIYILGKIANDILKYGVKRMQNDTIYKATLLNQMVTDHASLMHFVKSEAHRSKSTIVANAKNAKSMIESMTKKGMVLGSGYGPYKGEHIRIANFPTHSKESIEQLCDIIGKIE